MNLVAEEARFLTALVREQNQSGCRGPAHDLLRKQVYPDAPLAGPGSLTFAYDAVPLTSILLQEFTDLQAIDDFLRQTKPPADFSWPWASADEYHARLKEAHQEWQLLKATATRPVVDGADVGDIAVRSCRTATSG
jgi:hypothetical protein